MLLSTYRRRRYDSDPGGKPVQVTRGVGTEKVTSTSMDVGSEPGPKNDAGVQTQYSTPATEAQGGTTQLKTRVIEPQTDFDEYGTELHRDARVWKVYVQETDKFDGELVKGWNDSTDVILIFAALFSAISTAFLIESSKMLQPDPADVSARTLAVISQTLLTLANGTQLPGSMTPSSDSSTEFVPSRTAIYVNTLWYLSLSLSLATSFIAILSKDWCHAFMSGRTGHPYTQTFRRQQKWDMLERWKMSELLAVLPSMIHVALLLFSVGLCILLWDMHNVVAVPVICISGIAFGFYVCSSVAAIALDFFPYPTIISKLCRTKPVQLTFRHFSRVITKAVMESIPKLITETIPLIVTRGPYLLAWYLIYVLTELESLIQPVVGDMHTLLRAPARKVWTWLENRALRHMYTASWINAWFEKPSLTLEWTKMDIKPVSTGGNPDTETGEEMSLVLSWLIKNCETPQSVDIVLQSIAGATSRIAHQPLLDCKAPLQILRRLASSNLYRGQDTNSKVVELLYVRALSFLNTSTKSDSADQRTMGRDLEALIWDLQVEAERKLATLIERGDLDPTHSNLEALRMGSTLVSSSLKILRNDVKNASVKEIFNSIIRLLQSHLNQAQGLHNAALFSLTHAATLLMLIAPASATASQDSKDSLPVPAISPDHPTESARDRGDKRGLTDTMTALPSLLLQLATDPHRPKLITGLAATSIIFCHLRGEQTQRRRPGHTTWTEEVLRGLVERYAEGEITLEWVENIKPPSIATAEQYSSAKYISQLERNFLSEYQAATLLTLPTVEVEPAKQDDHTFQEGFVSSNLSALWAIHSLRPATAPSPALYVLVVEIMCRTPPSSPLFACGAQMLSKCPFPTLSEELATALEQRDLVPLLETTSTNDNWTKRYFAQGQLWLLVSLYMYAGDTASGRDKLKVQLDKCRGNGSEGEEGRHRGLCALLVHVIEPGSVRARELGGWACRLQECVRQLADLNYREDIADALHNIPPELRGLSSFTSWPRRAGDPPTNEPRPAEEEVDETGERTNATNVTTEGEGETGGDGHLQSPDLVADTGKAETQGEDDAGRADSGQALEATAQGPPAGDGKSLADVNSQEEVDGVRGEENSVVEAPDDERRVADAGDAKEATGGPQSEGEEAGGDDVAQGGGNEAHQVIDMGGLENQPEEPPSSS